MKTKRGKKIKVSYLWASGYSGTMLVEKALIGAIYKALRDDDRVYDVLFNGLTYQEFVRIYGGLLIAA